MFYHVNTRILPDLNLTVFNLLIIECVFIWTPDTGRLVQTSWLGVYFATFLRCCTLNAWMGASQCRLLWRLSKSFAMFCFLGDLTAETLSLPRLLPIVREELSVYSFTHRYGISVYWDVITVCNRLHLLTFPTRTPIRLLACWLYLHV